MNIHKIANQSKRIKTNSQGENNRRKNKIIEKWEQKKHSQAQENIYKILAPKHPQQSNQSKQIFETDFLIERRACL